MEGSGGEYKVEGGLEGCCLSRCINQYPLRTAKVGVVVGVGERERTRERLLIPVCVHRERERDDNCVYACVCV